MFTTIVDFIMANKASIALAIPFMTRSFYQLKNGGGLVGVWNSIMYGTAVPKDKKPKQEGSTYTQD